MKLCILFWVMALKNFRGLLNNSSSLTRLGDDLDFKVLEVVINIFPKLGSVVILPSLEFPCCFRFYVFEAFLFLESSYLSFPF